MRWFYSIGLWILIGACGSVNDTDGLSPLSGAIGGQGDLETRLPVLGYAEKLHRATHYLEVTGDPWAANRARSNHNGKGTTA